MNYQAIVNELVGLSVHPMGAAADMLWIHFGPLKVTPDRYGKMKEVGQWALHLQCSWRFVQNNKVILASSDFYYDGMSGESLDLDSDQQSMFQRNVEKLNTWIKSTKVTVSSIKCSEAGAFDLLFDNGLKFTVIPTQSDEITEEAWRLFKPTSDESHIVYPPESLT